jgi:MFS family permease
MKKRRHRNAIWAAHDNGFLWGIGQGLLNSMMIRYLLIDLCKAHPETLALEGTAVAWAIAGPRLAGFFRVFTTMFIDLCGSRKWFCIVGLLIAPLFVGLIPLGVPRLIAQDSPKAVLVFVIAMWFLYHLVEYLAMVAFYSWVGDLVPTRVRTRFFAWRQGWLLAGTLIGVFLATRLLPELFPVAENASLERYLAPAMFGGLFKFVSVLPLVKTPEIAWHRTAFRFGDRLVQMFAPLANRRFMLLVGFVSWIHLANGLTQATQTRYNYWLFPGEAYAVFALFGTLTQTGQLFLSPPTGWLIQRFGNARVMAVSMVLVSTGSLCYFAAMPGTKYFLALAAVAWVFWVGVNIGSINMAITLARPDEKTAWLAFYFAVTTGVFALGTILGGELADCFRETAFTVPLTGATWNYAQLSFVLSWLMRLFSGIWLIPFFWQSR